jgi:hypothetical protein
VNQSGNLAEVQVRTKLQHLWAELSEKLSDVVDKQIKYGGGADTVAAALTSLSESTKALEAKEIEFQILLVRAAEIRSAIDSGNFSNEMADQMRALDAAIEDARRVIIEGRQTAIQRINEVIASITVEKEPK